jgi:hypothetical protein
MVIITKKTANTKSIMFVIEVEVIGAGDAFR